MHSFRWIVPVLTLVLVSPAWGQEAKAKPHPVPYRLTDTQHVMVRVKINGKGPFNFIVDTGAPIVIISKEVGKKLKLETDEKGWAVVDKLEMEGGLSQAKFKCLVTTPFQIDGMNDTGMAGVELHGILGYTLLAKYRMEFDFTKDKMNWTDLNFKPPPPEGLPGKGGGGGLEMMGPILKIVAFMAGMKPASPPSARGFVGIELAEGKDGVDIKTVFAKGPAADSGIEPGDRLIAIAGKEINTYDDALKQTAQILPGQTVRLTVLRDGEKREIKITAGEGL